MVNAEIRPGVFVFGIHAQPNRGADCTVKTSETAHQMIETPSPVPINCAVRLTPPSPPENNFWPKMPAAMPPQTPHSQYVTAKDTEYVIDLPAVLFW